MQAYCTISAAASAEAEEPLSREVKVNAKTILGGVAVTAFVLGMMAATAARSSSPVGASQLSLRPARDKTGRALQEFPPSPPRVHNTSVISSIPTAIVVDNE